jgi:outer membrane protein assembly factor BamB
MEVLAMSKKMAALVFSTILISVSVVFAQDWPQWRGTNRDAKATLTAPASWPKELNKKWTVSLGVGADSTPALVGDKLYSFTRIDANETIICLDAATGKELWRDSYAAAAVAAPATAHSGPRSSPTVADGKIFTLGVGGVVSCWDTASHKLLWRKDDFPNTWPRFFTSMSPLVTDGLCIAHVGGQNSGAVIAYALATGEPKWKWPGPGPSYSSPSIMTVGDTKMVVVMTENNMVGLNIANAALLWEIPFAPSGMGYNTFTPIVDGTTIYYGGDGGRGVTAVTIKKDGDKFTAEQLWSNTDNSTQYNTPILKNGFLYGFSQTGSYFCVEAKSGKTAWAQAVSTAAPAGGRASIDSSSTGNFVITPAAMGGGRGGAMGGGGRGGRGGGGGGGMGGAGFGTIVDTGSVLLGLNSAGKLVILEPNQKEYKELASYQVTSTPVYAYPVASGNRIYISDQTSIALWTLE